MIIFEKVRFKNFGSFGNNYTEIVLNKNNTTLICGNNGSGKSFAFLDSITFALFGKPFRKINIPQLSNSINSKNCLVEIEFSKGNEKFLIKRGINPRIFEIYKNGNLVDQDAKTSDYQDYLETQILKMNYKTFTQVVILGSSSFVPFMQLPAADRRAVIENILDINIFSTMNVVLKGKILSLKETIKELNTKLEIERNKINVQRSYISTLEKKNNEDNDDKLSRIKELEDIVRTIDAKILIEGMQIGTENAEIDSCIVKIKERKERLKEIQSHLSELNSVKKTTQKQIEFFKNNCTCPTCSQEISEPWKKDKIVQCNLEISNTDDSIYQGNEIVKQIEEHITALETSLENGRQRQSEYRAALREIENYNKEIEKIKLTLNKSIVVDNLEQEKEKLNQLEGGLKILEDTRSEETSDLMYHELANELLKDGGVKAKIIKYYLPYMNKFINKFLTSMDFFIQFHMDEEFNEQIKSRHRDEFSYMNFSEGEKMRIDLALLLAWREIARIKNSINCNLLILDEVFDSSLDTVGMDELMKLLKIISDKANVYVISHKADQLIDKFSNTIVFEKKNNFSKMINN
jgi:DNA repair exonuclease SbcCD ATPase subunit